jgi:hypothetical protein
MNRTIKITVPSNIRRALLEEQKNADLRKKDLEAAASFLVFAKNTIACGELVDFNALSPRCIKLIEECCGYVFEKFDDDRNEPLLDITLYDKLPPGVNEETLRRNFNERHKKKMLEEVFLPIQYLILKHQVLTFQDKGKIDGTSHISGLHSSLRNNEILEELGRRGLSCHLKTPRGANNPGEIGSVWRIAWSDSEIDKIKLDKQRNQHAFTNVEFFNVEQSDGDSDDSEEEEGSESESESDDADESDH